MLTCLVAFEVVELGVVHRCPDCDRSSNINAK
jgi:hypothetical protein